MTVFGLDLWSSELSKPHNLSEAFVSEDIDILQKSIIME